MAVMIGIDPHKGSHTAVAIGPEPRSIAGGRLELLEKAIMVTECDAMRSYGRA